MLGFKFLLSTCETNLLSQNSKMYNTFGLCDKMESMYKNRTICEKGTRNERNVFKKSLFIISSKYILHKLILIFYFTRFSKG